MFSKSRVGFIKTMILSLAVALISPMPVRAQTDSFTVPLADGQDERESDIYVDQEELFGQSGTDADAPIVRAQSGAREVIHEALRQHAERIDVQAYNLTFEEARALVKDIVYWDGSLFYVKTSIGGKIGRDYTVYIYPQYIENEKAIEKALKRAIRESIIPGMSDLRKILALHDWLAMNCSYDDSHEKYTAYDALVMGSAVCQGYADAYEMLLRYAGIVEVGTASGGGHIWNQVKVDGQWYNVDVTYDSGIVSNSTGGMGYSNFLLSDSKFRYNHDIRYQDHECTSTLYDDGCWWHNNPDVESAVVPVNGTASYKIDYEVINYKSSVMRLIYHEETTGEERVVRVFDNADWKYQRCYGFLQRVGGTVFLNDSKNVYRITDEGNISVIYTYEGTDGRKIYGIQPENGDLKVQISYGWNSREPGAELRTISLEPYIEEDFEVKGIKDFVRRMYRITLGREADSDGLNYYVDKLQSGEMDGSSVAQGFVGSPEFQGKKLSADDYLAALYSAFFDRSAGPAEIQYWKDQMASGMSRKYVLRGFVNSDEFEKLCRDAGISRGLMVLEEGEEYEIDEEKLGAFVERLYVKALQREAEPDGKKYWVAQIAGRKVTAEEAAKKFFFSPEFESFHTSNTEYIARLYETFMGRTAEPAGMEYWLNEMSRGMSREVVLSRFAASPEFKNIMESFGLR